MKITDFHSADLTTLLRPIAADLEHVRRRIRQTLTDPLTPVGDCLSQLDLCGGKMLRPAMVLLSGRCVGPVCPEQIELAAIMEMVHVASLLHDDVIDHAQTRRGRSSANALWGNTQAVLMGDYVLSKAFAMGAAIELPGASAILCQTAEAICTGEIHQNMRKGDWQLSEADYLAIIEAKTASLFGACCHLGALAGRAEVSLQDHLRRYGEAIGMAFQMTDDLLDILGSAKTEGKTLGTDLLNEKLTMPVIHWIGQDGEGRVKQLKQFCQNADRAGLCEAIVSGGAVDYTRRRAEAFAHTASDLLAELPETEAKESLRGLVCYILGRA